MRDDLAKRFEEREARLGDEIARRGVRVPRSRAADPSLQPSTGPTFARTVARAMNCPGPAPDTRRPVSAAGATTSHLKVTSVRHAGAAREPDGLGPSRCQAAQHQAYIERAVAVERSLTVVQSDAEPEQQQARRQQAYMERSAAVERVEETVASFGNLGRTPEERAAFWAAVEESGHPARSYAVATCHCNRSPEFWRAVSDDPTAPACLKALDGPGPYKLTFKTEAEAAPVIAFADSHGETSAKAKAERAIVLNPGRASRIQTRIILELPHELTAAQRLKLAKRICQELFGGGQIRYWAAIHAPDSHNDARNFHLHIAFSDRPARKITDASGARKWDFEIVERQVDAKNHNVRFGRPYRQIRDRSFSARPWIKQTRARVAEFVNDALAEAGVERRIDPRRYSEMGVDLEPEPRAPARAYALEKRGVETAAARPTIEAQWRRARQRLSQQYDDFQPDAEIEARFDSASQRASDLIDTTLRLDALTAAEQWRSAIMRIHTAEVDVAALRFNMAKIRSRLAPPIETGDRRDREASLAQLATIEAEFLAEIGQQAAVAAAAEARALETLATLERALAVSAAPIRLGAGIEGQTAEPAAAPGVALDGDSDGAMRSPSARRVASDELWTLYDQCAALRARALALASSSALACVNLNDTTAADQRRAAQASPTPSQFDGLEHPDHGGLTPPAAELGPASKSASDAAQGRRPDLRRTQQAVAAADLSVALAARGLALSATSAAADCELASETTAAMRQRQAAAVAAEATTIGGGLLQTDPVSSTLAPNPPSLADESEERRRRQRRRARQREQDHAAGDESFAEWTRALALSSSASLAELAIAADETSMTLARRAAFAAERAIAVERAQFDETTDFAANAANVADLTSAQEEEHADERPDVEYDLGADRSANRGDGRPLPPSTRDDEQVAKESDGRARKPAGADEDAERATAARRDLGGASNPAGGYPARDLGESRSGAGRSDVQANREMRNMSPSGGGVRGAGAAPDRQAGDQSADAGVSGGTQVPAGARTHDVQSVSANAGRADGVFGSANQPGAPRDKLMAEYQLRLQKERDRLRTFASAKGTAPAAAEPEPRDPSVAASAMHAASKPISRPDVHTDSASSNAVNRDQTARLDSIRAEIAAGEQVAREIEAIRAGSAGRPPRYADASSNHTASEAISRLEVHTDCASAGAIDRDQTARLNSVRADIAASEQVAREIEKIRAGGASPPHRNAEASPVAAPSNPISPPEVHFDNAPPGAAADRNQLESIDSVRAEEDIRAGSAGSAPRQVEAAVVPTPQAPVRAEPLPAARPDGDKPNQPAKEGLIIDIGGRALNDRVLQRKPPGWER